MARGEKAVVVRTFGPENPATYQAGESVVKEINDKLGIKTPEEMRRERLADAGMTALQNIPKLVEAASLFGGEFSSDQIRQWSRYLPDQCAIGDYEGIEPPDDSVSEIKIARTLDCFELEVWSNKRESMVVGCYPKKQKRDSKEDWAKKPKHYFGIVRWGTPRGKAQTLPTLEQLRHRRIKEMAGIVCGGLLTIVGIVLTLVFLAPRASSQSGTKAAHDPAMVSNLRVADTLSDMFDSLISAMWPLFALMLIISLITWRSRRHW